MHITVCMCVYVCVRVCMCDDVGMLKLGGDLLVNVSVCAHAWLSIVAKNVCVCVCMVVCESVSV